MRFFVQFSCWSLMWFSNIVLKYQFSAVVKSFSSVARNNRPWRDGVKKTGIKTWA